MYRAEVPITNLLPIESCVYADGLAVAEALIRDTGRVKDIPLVPFPDDEGRLYIMADGHHEAVAAYRLGLLAVPGLICVTTEDLQNQPMVNRMMLHNDIDTIEGFRLVYREVWGSDLSRYEGIRRLSDLAAKEPKVRRRRV
jgi:hypothetical protein